MCFKVNGFRRLSTVPGQTRDSASTDCRKLVLERAGPPSEKTCCTFVLVDPHPCTIDALEGHSA